MRIVDFAQRTPEWHRWRAGGVTASEAAIVMGRSPYQTPWQLWAEKVGLILPQDLSANPNVLRGVRQEPYARKAYEQQTGDLILPLCAEYDANPVFRASFDGINSSGEPVEFKCPSQTTFEEVKKQAEQSESYQLYWVQVQHQLLVAGAQRGWLVFFYEDELIDFEVQRDDKFLDELQEPVQTFWQLIESHTEPAKDPERDNYVPSGEEQFQWEALAKSYCSAHQEASALETKLKNLKQSMKSDQKKLSALMGEYAHADYAGIRLCRYTVSGSVDYRTLITEQFGEPDEVLRTKYRKPSSERWRVSVTQAQAALAPADVATQSSMVPAAPRQSVNSFYF